MRKGYSAAGVSFAYSFTTFQGDLADMREMGETVWTELVVGGNTYTAEINPDMTESGARSLFDAMDHVQIANGRLRYQLRTGV